jgi:hypothetical protein
VETDTLPGRRCGLPVVYESATRFFPRWCAVCCWLGEECLLTLRWDSVLRKVFDRRVTCVRWHPVMRHLAAVSSHGGDVVFWNSEQGALDKMSFSWIEGWVESFVRAATSAHQFVRVQDRVLAALFEILILTRLTRIGYLPSATMARCSITTWWGAARACCCTRVIWTGCASVGQTVCGCSCRQHSGTQRLL